MAKIEGYAPGSFCWAELATTDAESAKKFYSALFNWSVNDHPTPQGTYTIFQVDGNDAAAMYTVRPGEPPRWGVYFSTANVDESAAKVAPLGGKIVGGPFDVMDLGRMAIVQDPQGAMFCLWQAGKHYGATHGGPLSQVSWPELATTDPAGAVAFYSGLFGWKTKPETGFDKAEYVEWTNRGTECGGMLPMRGDHWKGVPPHWGIYVTVADCDERTAKAKELGANVCVPPTDIPNVGRFSVIADAQNAVFALIKLNPHEKK